MAYVVAAYWRAKDGEEETIRRLLPGVAAGARAEPGCRLFEVQVSVDDPREFLLYEQYDDEAAFLAHRESEHFKTHVLGDAVPRLERRERVYYETIG